MVELAIQTVSEPHDQYALGQASQTVYQWLQEAEGVALLRCLAGKRLRWRQHSRLLRRGCCICLCLLCGLRCCICLRLLCSLRCCLLRSQLLLRFLLLCLKRSKGHLGYIGMWDTIVSYTIYSIDTNQALRGLRCIVTRCLRGQQGVHLALHSHDSLQNCVERRTLRDSARRASARCASSRCTLRASSRDGAPALRAAS